MMERTEVRNLSDMAKGLSGWQKNPSRPPSSFQRRLESSGLNNPFPQSGNDSPISVNQSGKNRRHPDTPAPPPWIPACAGMTVGAGIGHLPSMAKGLSGCRQTHSHPCRHSSEGWNPGDGGQGGEEVAGFAECPRSVVVAAVGIPAVRECFIKTTGFRPSPE